MTPDAMVTVDRPAELAGYLGQALGPSPWVTVDQDMIDRFAEATGDRQWIHLDAERAARELPSKRTIAHGYLVLSLLPVMMERVYRIETCSRHLNYGANKVRFTNPVPSGARVRLLLTFLSVEPSGDDGRRIVAECTVEIEGEERPALVAEIVSLAFP